MNSTREMRIYSLLNDDPSIILMFKYKYTTENMWKIAIENEPSLFQYMKNPSEEMIMLALTEDGANIQYLERMGIEITPKMMYVAIRSYPRAIYLIPKELRSERLREYACSEDSTLMNELPLHRNFVDKQLRIDPTLMRFIKDPTEEQICEAIRIDPAVCAYIEKFTPKIKKLIKELYPEIIPLIPRLSEQFTKSELD